MIDAVNWGLLICVIVSVVNPILVGLLLAQVIIDHRDKVAGWACYAAASISSLVATQFADHAFRVNNIWASHPGFPSGHMMFAVSIATSLTLRESRWIWYLAPILMIFAIAIILNHMHDPIDIVGSVVITPFCVYGIHRLFCRSVPKLPGKPIQIPHQYSSE